MIPRPDVVLQVARGATMPGPSPEVGEGVRGPQSRTESLVGLTSRGLPGAKKIRQQSGGGGFGIWQRRGAVRRGEARVARRREEDQTQASDRGRSRRSFKKRRGGSAQTHAV